MPKGVVSGKQGLQAKQGSRSQLHATPRVLLLEYSSNESSLHGNYETVVLAARRDHDKATRASKEDNKIVGAACLVADRRQMR